MSASHETESLIQSPHEDPGQVRPNADTSAEVDIEVGPPSALRWVALAQFSVQSFMSSMQWLTFANIVPESEQYFGLSAVALDWLSAIYYVVFILTAVLGIAWLNRFGLKRTLLVGSLCNLGGGLLKIAALWSPGWGVLALSQVVAGVAQACFLPGPPVLAGQWFADNERAVATALAALANAMGGAVGLLFPPVFVSGRPHRDAFLKLFLVMNAVMATELVVLLLVPAHPKLAPSEAAAARRRREASQQSLSLLECAARVGRAAAPHVRDWRTMALVVGTGLASGCVWAFSSIIDQVGSAYGTSESEIGWVSFENVAFGVVVSTVLGAYVDRTRAYKVTLVATTVAVVVGYCLMGVLLLAAPTQGRRIVIVMYAVLGGFQNTVLPIGFEGAVETTFPLDEIVCGAIVLMCSAGTALVLMGVLPAILALDSLSAQHSAALAVFLLAIITLVALALVAAGRVLPRRRDFENAAAAERKEHSGESAQVA